MDTKLEKCTEDKILEAAKSEFIEKGFDGARMQKIAERAEINKALLHYYFRSKENLFKAVFQSVFKDFFPNIIKALSSDISFWDKLKIFIDGYLDLLKKNPYLPAFILHEIHLRPEILLDRLKEMGIQPILFTQLFYNEFEKGTIKKINPEHVIVNILSMCIFPVAAKPVIKGIFMNNNEENYMTFLDERKDVIFEFVYNALKKD